MSDYSDIADAIRVAEERAEAGFVGCVTVRLDTLKLWRAKMLIAAEQEPQGAPLRCMCARAAMGSTRCDDCQHDLSCPCECRNAKGAPPTPCGSMSADLCVHGNIARSCRGNR